jgi:hypothetical protein
MKREGIERELAKRSNFENMRTHNN